MGPKVDAIHGFLDRGGRRGLITSPELLADAPQVRGLVFADSRWDLRQGQWQRSPVDANLADDEGARLAEAWSGARALAVSDLDPDLAWSERVVLELGDATQRREFRIARVGRMVFLARDDPPLQYHFSDRQADKLLPASGRGPARP